MQSQRLLGKTLQDIERSALVQSGGLAFKERWSDADDTETSRYAAPMVELRATKERGGALVRLMLLITNPARAAREEDDRFGVTVIGADREKRPADFGTGATLTFLRESLGCPMTTASSVYALLLAAPEGGAVEWADISLAFATTTAPDRPEEQRHGLVVRLR